MEARSLAGSHLLKFLHQTENLFVLPCDSDAGVPCSIRFSVIYLLQIKVEVTQPLFYRFPPLRYFCEVIIILERN